MDNVRQGFVEPEQFAAVAERLEPPYRDAVTFAYLAARRIGDVVGLPWAWVDRQGREIRWPTTKNGQALALPLIGDLGALIEAE